MVTVMRTDSNNPDFINLVRLLDKYLVEVFGLKREYYDQFNIINDSTTVAVAYENEIPVGCGCLRKFDTDSVEIKGCLFPTSIEKRELQVPFYVNWKIGRAN